MDKVSVQLDSKLGYGFVGSEFMPANADEYYLRNEQLAQPVGRWRKLSGDEIKALEKNGNVSGKWGDVLVTDEFDVGQVRNCEFYGLVRIGRVRNVVLEFDGIEVPCGITNSRIVACDIGDDAAIHNVGFLAHYIIGDRCIVSDVDEMVTTCVAKFGNGIVKDGEDESDRVWMDVMNEASSRSVLPFDGMRAGDAYLWAKWRDDVQLQKKLKEITQKSFESRRGVYGTIGAQSVIKSCGLIKDVKVGSHCSIAGANKLENVTVNSSESEPTRIGEGVSLVDGIVGVGCCVLYGAMAIRFVVASHSNLKYGVRLIDTYLGDNSTVSCGEVLNNLIFGAHEQHHNNSFLIASVVKGQSNIAAGATIGSNHNSRSNDGEIEAGRGFWPGLCTSLKHSCRFASFVLLAKGDYPAELNIPLPFSLVNNNASKDRLEIMPAYWWRYNMYALARNERKFKNRDKRIARGQNVEFDSLAPDTVEEIVKARNLLKGGTIKGMEKSRREVIIIDSDEALQAYGEMLHYYAVKNLMEYFTANPGATFDSTVAELGGKRERDWENVGGQLITRAALDAVRSDIVSGKLGSWDDIHHRWDELWDGYALEKQRHAFGILCEISERDKITKADWVAALDRAVEIQELICERVYSSRKKDFDNPFRQATYRCAEEMTAVVGGVDEDAFVKEIQSETEEFKKMVAEIRTKH